jgi:L-ascorbate metabolism protein UlaG (beta-lactamase superfamily)
MRRAARWLALALVVAGCAVKKIPPEMGNPKFGIDVTWHGHSCFSLRDSVDRTIVIDPFDETVGYGRLRLYADALLITHDHFDHNNRAAVHARLASIDLVDSTGTATVANGVLVTGIAAAHDNEQGQINGPDTFYAFQFGGLRCLHMGDVGQSSLTEFQKKMIGRVDVLFIPVGGATTIDARQAKAFVEELKPGAVFPMHYGDIRFYKLASVEDFASLFAADQVRRLDSSSVRIRAADLTDRPIVYILSSQNRN